MSDSRARLRAHIAEHTARTDDPSVLVSLPDLRAVLADLDAAAEREAAMMEALRRIQQEAAGRFGGGNGVRCLRIDELAQAALVNPSPAAEALLRRLADAERERDRLAEIERHVVDYLAWNTTVEACDCGDCFECDVRPLLAEKVAARVKELEGVQ